MQELGQIGEVNTAWTVSIHHRSRSSGFILISYETRIEIGISNSQERNKHTNGYTPDSSTRQLFQNGAHTLRRQLHLGADVLASCWPDCTYSHIVCTFLHRSPRLSRSGDGHAYDGVWAEKLAGQG